MNRQKWILLLGVLLLIGSTAVFLGSAQSHRRLGPPGLKLVSQPVYDSQSNIIGTTTVDLPVTVLDYQSRPTPVTTMELDWLPKDTTYGRRQYEAPNRSPIVISVVLMGTDRGSIHKPQMCLVGQGWKIERSDLESVPIAQPHAYELPVMRLTASKTVKLSNGNEVVLRSLYVYWFAAENSLTARHGERMWWMAKELIRTGTLQRWAYVACWSQCVPGQEGPAFQRMKEFIAAAVPQFQLAVGPPGAAQRSP